MEKTSQSADSNSSSYSSFPMFGRIDLLLYHALFNGVHSFSSKFWFFLPSQLSPVNSKVKEDIQISDSELSHQDQESLGHGNRDDEKLERDEVKMLMAKLGLFSSPGSEELEERYSCSEISGLFEEEEPSSEEVRQAFDVFDENRDGFIDARELQRILCILGLKEANELDNCKQMITNFDENGDGRIDFNEFVKIMENSFH